jgi:hypothetical protein
MVLDVVSCPAARLMGCRVAFILRRNRAARCRTDIGKKSSMTLLDEVIQASGGLERWRQLRRFTAHLSIGGALCERMHGSGSVKDVVVEGGVHEQALEITGFTGPDRRALYRPDWLALERSDGELLKERRGTAAEFRRDLNAGAWDELLLAFYCGSLIRSYLDVPFVLADADVPVSELAPTSACDKGLRLLHARFPERLAAHSAENTFYFDSQALLRRQEHSAPQEDGTRVARMFSGHQRYSGIIVPTLCRLLRKKKDGAMIARPACVDIEIFDVAFE